MCNMSNLVNPDMVEMEFDYYLSLAKLFDEGYPSIPHAPISNASDLRPPTDGISEKCDPTPKECATTDAPFRE